MSDPTVPARPSLRRDPALDFLVVIPTCGDPAVLVPTVKRVLEHAELRMHVAIGLNPIDPAKAADAVAAIRSLPGGSSISITEHPGPVGFAKAVNSALRTAEAQGGLAALNVVLNDDTRVTAGWLRGLQAAADSPTIRISAEPAVDAQGTRADRDAAAYGRIGLVGPVSDRVAGLQAIRTPDTVGDLDAFAAQHRLRAAGEVLAADFLSGFCVAVRFEALDDLAEWSLAQRYDKVAPPKALGPWTSKEDSVDLSLTGLGEIPGDSQAQYNLVLGPARWSLFDERFGIGGFEDNDLCVRAELAGWRCAIAGEVFIHHVGHQTLDKYPGQMRGMANRLTYYQKWAADPRVNGKRLVAVYRTKLETVQDLHYWRTSIARLAPLVDGIAILATNNPLDIQGSQDWPDAAGLPPSDQQLLRDCSNADAAGVARALKAWAERTALPHVVAVATDVWALPFNERDERNALLAIGESLSPDWMLSVDHDEVIEPRVDRALFERLMSHPDPLVRCWDFGWVNHWDSPRLVRQDPPWGDGGSFRGGMRGFRMWRVSQAAPRRILSGNAIGLHCGNVPMHDPLACRVSGIRFRHYGYLRVQDRFRKHARYTTIDPNPDAALTGGGYGHLVSEEGMRFAPFVQQDGIGLSMLVHGGEKPEDVARHLDVLHGVVDRAVLVWTDPEADGDPVNPNVTEFARLFDAAIILHPLDQNFAAARNAGMDYLRQWAAPQGKRPPSLGWILSLDPDEHLQDFFSDSVAIRRMAESSDAYGFMFRFANLRPQGTDEHPTMSETIRLIRLDPGNLMRWRGRIHEGFDRALYDVLATGDRPMLRTAPFVVVNPGLAGDDLALERKTRFYQSLLLRELQDDWDNAGAWVALGMQYTNDGFPEKAAACYHRAVLCSGEGYLPYRELMLHHLRIARLFAAETVKLVHEGHPYYGLAAESLRWLRANAPEQPLVGLARRGQVPPEADVPLPWHPKADGPKPEPVAPAISRYVEIRQPDGSWRRADYDTVQVGDEIQIFEPDGTLANGGGIWKVLSLPSGPNGMIDTDPVDEVAYEIASRLPSKAPPDAQAAFEAARAAATAEASLNAAGAISEALADEAPAPE